MWKYFRGVHSCVSISNVGRWNATFKWLWRYGYMPSLLSISHIGRWDLSLWDSGGAAWLGWRRDRPGSVRTARPSAHHPPQAWIGGSQCTCSEDSKIWIFFSLLADSFIKNEFYRLSTVSFGFLELVEKLSQLSIVKSNDSDERGWCDKTLLRIFMIHRNITFITKNNSSNNHIKRSEIFRNEQ